MQQSLVCPLHERLFVNLRPALQTFHRHFQNVIRDTRIGIRQAIENVIEWQFGIFATVFAAGNHSLCFLQSRSIDGNDVLLFGSGIEEIATVSIGFVSLKIFIGA